jgi:hypothetical protein
MWLAEKALNITGRESFTEVKKPQILFMPSTPARDGTSIDIDPE